MILVPLYVLHYVLSMMYIVEGLWHLFYGGLFGVVVFDIVVFVGYLFGVLVLMMFVVCFWWVWMVFRIKFEFVL